MTRSETLPQATDITSELFEAGMDLLTEKLPTGHLPVRLLGFGVKNWDISGCVQRQLFDESAKERQRQLDRVADETAEKFGKGAIRRGVRRQGPED